MELMEADMMELAGYYLSHVVLALTLNMSFKLERSAFTPTPASIPPPQPGLRLKQTTGSAVNLHPLVRNNCHSSLI
jgi:hypothetical protein